MVDMDSELILENHRLTQRSIALSQLEYAIFEEYSKVASANETWVDPVQAVGWMSREIARLRQRVAELEAATLARLLESHKQALQNDLDREDGWPYRELMRKLNQMDAINTLLATAGRINLWR